MYDVCGFTGVTVSSLASRVTSLILLTPCMTSLVLQASCMTSLVLLASHVTSLVEMSVDNLLGEELLRDEKGSAHV